MRLRAYASWIELAVEAMVNLRAQGRRSFMALIGVMIGAASIVALLGFIHIGRQEAMTRFQQVGVDTIQIATDPAAVQWLDLNKLKHLVRGDDRVLMLAPLATSRGQVLIGRNSVPAGLVAVAPQAANLLGLAADQGRGLSAADGCNAAVLLGAELAREAKATLGDPVFINGYGYAVVGILAPQTPQALSPVTINQAVILGEGCSRRILPDGVSHALIRLRADVDADAYGKALRGHLLKAGQLATVQTPQEMIAAMNSQMNLMAAILVAIGSVSLLVGGVGVMNVMLMSVMERRREIGLRAAIGATPSEIVFIFVVEAVALSLGGGLLGAFAGVVLTAIGCLFLPFSFAFDPMILLWGTGVAGVTGLVFGIHPAVAASRILPVEALRAD